MSVADLGMASEDARTPTLSKTSSRLTWQEIDLDAMWAHHEENPRLFSHVEIAIDGGLNTEVKELWDPFRWFSASMSMVFLCMNVRALFILNLKILFEPWWHRPSYFLLFNKLLHPIIIRVSPGEHSENFVRPASLVAACEVACFLFMLLCIFMTLRDIVRKDKSRGFRWHAVAKLFLEQIPLLMVFSGMKLLSAVTPQVLIPALTEKVQFALRQPSCKGVPSLAVFLVSRVVYFIIGFDVFLVKFHATVYGEKGKDPLEFWTAIPFLVFLNQMLGVVQLGSFVRWRLMLFIFGGEDGVMQDDENALQMTFHALLAQRIFSAFPGPRGVALLLTYSDKDFQKLVLNDSGVTDVCFGTTSNSNSSSKLDVEMSRVFRRSQSSDPEV